MRLARDGRLPMFHPEARYMREAARLDRIAAKRYRELAELTDEPEHRVDYLQRARECGESARRWDAGRLRDRREVR